MIEKLDAARAREDEVEHQHVEACDAEGLAGATRAGSANHLRVALEGVAHEGSRVMVRVHDQHPQRLLERRKARALLLVHCVPAHRHHRDRTPSVQLQPTTLTTLTTSDGSHG
jgi:hypothetical protein